MVFRKAMLSMFVTSYVFVTCAMEQELTKPATDSLITEAITSGPVLQDPVLAAGCVLDAPDQAVKSQKRKLESEAIPVRKVIKKAQNGPLATIAVLKRTLVSQRRAKHFFLEQTKQRLSTIESEKETLRGQISQLQTKIRTLEQQRDTSIPYKLLNYFSGGKDPKNKG